MTLQNSARVLLEPLPALEDTASDQNQVIYDAWAQTFPNDLASLPPYGHPDFNKAWLHVIEVVAASHFARDYFLRVKERNAQALVNSLETFLQSVPSLAPASRRMAIYILVGLAANSKMIPQTLLLANISELFNQHPLRGGYSKVFQGMVDDGGMIVALKGLKHASAEKNFARFAQELLIWCQLKHPHILPALGFFSIQSVSGTYRHYMVSPWCSKGSLTTYIRSQEYLSNKQPLRLLRETAEGLLYLHDLGITHADLKADNILVDDATHVLICDFGLVVVGHKTEGRIKTDQVAGTVAWTAPECLTPRATPYRPQPSVDTWSFGCLMWKIYTDQEPYDHIENQLTLHTLIPAGELPVPSPPSATIMPLPVWETTKRCWALDPEKRPTMRLLVGNLAAAEQGVFNLLVNGESSEQTGLLDLISGAFLAILARMWSPRREATLRLANHHYDKAIQLMSSMPSGLDYLKATTLKKQLERATKASVSIDSVPRSVTGYAKILRTHFQNPERYRAESEKLCELARTASASLARQGFEAWNPNNQATNPLLPPSEQRTNPAASSSVKHTPSPFYQMSAMTSQATINDDGQLVSSGSSDIENFVVKDATPDQLEVVAPRNTPRALAMPRALELRPRPHVASIGLPPSSKGQINPLTLVKDLPSNRKPPSPNVSLSLSSDESYDGVD